MEDELVKIIYNLMLKSEGEKEDLGFEIKLRFQHIFDGEKLELINKNLIEYREKHKKDLLIDKFLMSLFYDFLFSCQNSVGYDSSEVNSESQIKVINAVKSTVDIVHTIVDGYEGGDLAKKLGELLLKNNNCDDDGYLVKLKQGRPLDQNQMDEISNVLDEYCLAYSEGDYVEKYFMYVFSDFVLDSYDNKHLYTEDDEIMIEDFVDEISNKIWDLTDVESKK